MMMRQFTITLVRHGETLSNRNNVMQGQLDIPLSDIGQEQANLAAKRLHKMKFTHMYASDLSRAFETAKTIANANLASSCQLEADKRLRERGFGYLEGKPYSEFKKALDEANIPVASSEFTPEGGETMDEVVCRARAFLDDLFKMLAKPLQVTNTEEQSSNSKSSEGNYSSTPTTSNSTMKDEIINSLGSCCGNKCMEIETPYSLCDGKTEEEPDVHPGKSSDCDESEVIDDYCNVLIVSHGLFLRELKRLVLDRYYGKLEGDFAKEALRIPSNTAVSQFKMTIGYKYSKLWVRCDECLLMNDASHLVTPEQDLVSHFKMKGAF